MAWTVKWTAKAADALSRFDKPVARRIRDYMLKRVAPAENPRTFGKALRGPLREYWRYRIGAYRAICEIRDQEIIIVVVLVDHRKDAY